jgi:hypothetical protein
MDRDCAPITKLKDVEEAMNKTLLDTINARHEDPNDPLTWDSYAYPCGLMARSFFNGIPS